MGYLKDENGQPLKGKFVRLYLPNTWTVRTRTGDDGLFRLLLGATVERKGKGLVIKLGDRVMPKDSKAAEYALFMLPRELQTLQRRAEGRGAQVGAQRRLAYWRMADPHSRDRPHAMAICLGHKPIRAAQPRGSSSLPPRARRIYTGAMALRRGRADGRASAEQISRAVGPWLIIRVVEGLIAWLFFNEYFSIAGGALAGAGRLRGLPAAQPRWSPCATARDGRRAAVIAFDIVGNVLTLGLPIAASGGHLSPLHPAAPAQGDLLHGGVRTAGRRRLSRRRRGHARRHGMGRPRSADQRRAAQRPRAGQLQPRGLASRSCR